MTLRRSDSLLTAQLFYCEFLVRSTIRLIIGLCQTSSEGYVLGVLALFECRLVGVYALEIVRGVALACHSVQIWQGVTHFSRKLLLGESVGTSKRSSRL